MSGAGQRTFGRAADPTEGRRKLSYTHRGGFDVATTVGVLCGSDEVVGLQQKDVEADHTYLTIEPARDPVTPGALELRSSVSSDIGSGSVTFAGDGTVKRIDSANG